LPTRAIRYVTCLNAELPAVATRGARGEGEGWSLVCNFERPPSAQGDPSIAHVRYLMPNAQAHMIPSQLS
jgi:hypothetical protein